MQGIQNDYLAAYRSLKLTRDSEGVLVAEFHSNDGPFTFAAQDHTEFVDAFYRIAQDRANKKAPEVTRRNTRVHFIQPLKERIVREVGYGLSLEGASAADLVKSMQVKSAKGAAARHQSVEKLASSSGGALNTATVLRELLRSEPVAQKGKVV